MCKAAQSDYESQIIDLIGENPTLRAFFEEAKQVRAAARNEAKKLKQWTSELRQERDAIKNQMLADRSIISDERRVQV